MNRVISTLLALILSQQCIAQEDSPAKRYFTDVILINQYGEQMRFYSDLIRGKVVVINVFFTSCAGVCPPMARTLAAISERLGDKLGKQVHLISISVDPTTDTPERLREFAKKFNARPGWFFLTGKKENVELALSKLGQYVEVREDHSNIIIVGNEPTGLWKKAFGLAPPEELMRVVESVLNDDPNR
jgi:protein SCO1/2